MINVSRVHHAEFLYNRYENSTVINIELQESGMSAQTEITVAEAIEVRDKLTEEIEFIVGSSEKDLIDRDKLLEWIDGNWELDRTSGTQDGDVRAEMWRDFYQKVQSIGG